MYELSVWCGDWSAMIAAVEYAFCVQKMQLDNLCDFVESYTVYSLSPLISLNTHHTEICYKLKS
jgi:hypothetical protein